VAHLLQVRTQTQGFEHIPQSGRCVIVANHPTGIADGIAAWDAIKPIRPDLIFYANAEAHRVSAGFTDEHTEFERLNVEYLESLREALLALDINKLVIERKPGEKEPAKYPYSIYSGMDYDWDDYGAGHYMGHWNKHKDAIKKDYGVTKLSPAARYDKKFYNLEDHDVGFGDMLTEVERKHRYVDFRTICQRYPDHVADYLEGFGCSVEDLLDHIAKIESAPLNFR
jgi:hypothetical protein